VLIERLRQSALLDVEADFSSYGSGWASFVDIFCSKSHCASSRPGPTDHILTEGIRLYVSRLAPVAAFALSEVWRNPGGISFNFLEPTQVSGLLPGWSAERDVIVQCLQESSILVLPQEAAQQHLPFDAQLDTNLGEPPFRVFDAVFHWYD
jgi:hypothetical protein